MAHHTKLWYLERFRLLDALSQEQKRQVEQATQMLQLRRGERAYLPGDPSDRIFLLKSGVIKIAAVGADGRESILALLHPGDIFGELAVVDDSPRDHLAEAFQDAVICAMNRDLMLRLIRESPELGYQVTKILGFRLRTFRSRVEELLCRSAQARLAQALLDLAGEHGVPDADGVLIPLRLSQRDLGKLVGLSRETVNGVLQEFRQRGLVEADRRTIRIREPEALRAVR